MAVYTQVSPQALAAFLARYDCGTLRSAKGIAEGIENSNYLVETSTGRFILTLYEKRVHAGDLPFFLSMLDHLAARDVPVAPAVADQAGVHVQTLAGRPACLIRFLPGLSPATPTPAQAEAAGAALATMHLALADFAATRANDLGVDGWAPLLARCGTAIDAIAPGLHDRLAAALDEVVPRWPRALPRGAIHADFFPDNVLMLDDRVTGVIDFYFACTDLIAYDLAIAHGAWAFDGGGTRFDADVARALLRGYAAHRALSAAERDALPLLAMGACIRFALTRAWDWLNTPADALVTRKDPCAYLNRLDFYRAHRHAAFQ
ncbi:homoserine kinase [Sphingomonas sp.]|uniref:homoserine kinase n=1 Tax=Sphingomonas sp. TaxID=28214 RepID=UPI001DBE1D95|nr:homoserine kinase [Sphingomonas sp.]MBX9797601.1 homoserine kinase [Sphingomonas sp.]